MTQNQMGNLLEDLAIELIGNLSKEMDKIKSTQDILIDEVESINQVCRDISKDNFDVYVYKNSKDEEIYLKYPENLTVSDYQGYRFETKIKVYWDDMYQAYRQPYTMFFITMFHDIYHGIAPLPPGHYTVKMKRRKMLKRPKGNKKQEFADYQYCFDPSNIKRIHNKGYSGRKPWETCLCERIVTKDYQNVYKHNGVKIHPCDV